MNQIFAIDPLVLLGIQAGQINTPTSKDSVRVYSTNELENNQRFIEPGEAVPIVFARFRNNAGGILISPGASEAQFVNSPHNKVKCNYLLPISEGVIQGIPVKDVFQGACRIGSHNQAFSARAGTWPPGNYLIQRYDYTDPLNPVPYELPEAPYFCGSVGLYPNITTLSYLSPYFPNGSDRYRRQINIYIRGGMHVTRLYDNVYGPSDNFADLVKWLLSNTARIPSAMIDNAALTTAAQFLEYNGFTCNCELKNSTNYADFISKWAPYFLLGESNNGGKKGLRPLLPTTPAGAIDTSPITPAYTFTEDTILPNTLEIDYTSLSDRLPFVAQMLWRQQLESEIGIKRTIEVQYTRTPEAGPYELHDLSEFCTSENHAVKVGAYIIARRTYPTHVIRFAARPQAHNTELTVGDIIYVYLQRQATNYIGSAHAYFYQVERIGKTLAGDVTYEAVHFPVDSQNRSLIAIDVAAATGTGLLFPSVRTGVECDENASNNNTIPPSTSISPGDVNDPVIGGTDSATQSSVKVVPSGGNTNGPSGPSGPSEPNPDDGLDPSTPIPGGPIPGITGPNNRPQVGDTLGPITCGGTNCVTKWYAFDPGTGQQLTPELGFGDIIAILPSMVDKGIGAYTTCDSNECRSPVTPPVIDLPYNRYSYVRAVWTRTQNVRGADGAPGIIVTSSGVTPWFALTGPSAIESLYVESPSGNSWTGAGSGAWVLPHLNSIYKVGNIGTGGYSVPVLQNKKIFKDGTVGFTGVTGMNGFSSTIYFDDGEFLLSVGGSYQFSNDGETVDYTWNGLEPE